MDFELKTENGSEFQIFSDMPEDLKRFDKLIPCCLNVTGDFGKMLFYQIAGNGVTIRYSIYDMLHPVVIKARCDQSSLELRIALQNQISGTWEGIEKPTLAADHFSLSFTPYVKTRADFAGGTTYATYDLHYDYWFLVEMAKDFPVLAEFLEKAAKGKAADISSNLFVCTPQMTGAIRFIEKNPYGLRSQKHIIEYRAKEILIGALEKMSEEPAGKPMVLDDRLIEALWEARRLIEQNVEEEMSLAILVRKTRLNEYKLKKGFKTLFGMTPIDYHIQLKMELAMKLLLDTDQSVSQIAYTVGYHHASNFTIEFKKRFGCTPVHMRKYGRIK